MTAGSVFSAAGQLIVSELGVALPDWVVVYEFPRSEMDQVTDTGEMRYVYVEPEGESTYERTSLGRRGLTERCDLSLVFHRLVMHTDDVLSVVDDEIATATGVLVDLMCVDDPQWQVPDGWESIQFQPSGTSRTGGYFERGTTIGRRLEFTLSVTAARC